MAVPNDESRSGSAAHRLRRGLDHAFRAIFSNMPVLWLIAVVLGVAAGYAAVGFRLGIAMLQTAFYGADNLTIHSVAANLPWYIVLTLPIMGGLIVGWILSVFTPDGKARGVADVIQAAAVRSGRIEKRAGL
ncbi:MAG: chloride channel protein, partial [Pseudomonadota bacterium]